MAIDHGVIDQDHQALIAIVNDYLETKPTIRGKAALQWTLLRLKNYTLTHFAREEQLQTAINYPKLREHKLLHQHLAELLDKTTRNLIEFDLDRLLAQQPQFVDSDLVAVDHVIAEQYVAVFNEAKQLFRHWILNHFLTADIDMKPYFGAMRSAGTTMSSIWSATPAILATAAASEASIQRALLLPATWMPAGFRKDTPGMETLAEAGSSKRPKHTVHENPIFARMKAEAQRLGMPIELDPTCRHVNDRGLQEALKALNVSGMNVEIPLKQQFKAKAPAALQEAAALIELVGSMDSERRYAVRYTGPKVAGLFGDMTNRVINDAVDDTRVRRWHVLLDGVLEYGAPLHAVGVTDLFGHSDLLWEAVLAPFHSADVKEILVVLSLAAGSSGDRLE